jgi:hypothetical protein
MDTILSSASNGVKRRRESALSRSAGRVAPPKNKTTIQLKRTTHEDLCELRKSLYSLYQEGKITLPDEYAEHLTLDQTVAMLIDSYKGHRRRATEQRQRMAARAGAPS